MLQSSMSRDTSNMPQVREWDPTPTVRKNIILGVQPIRNQALMPVHHTTGTRSQQSLGRNPSTVSADPQETIAKS